MANPLYEHYYRIDLKDIPKRYETQSLVKVLSHSPMSVKREVEKFAYYFRREFHYDFVQYEASELGPYTAYLFASPEETLWVGACCFRTRHYEDLDLDTEALQWIWLHPYFRGRGVLREYWKDLRANHGDFYTEPPISLAMRQFLAKNNQDSVWHTIIDSENQHHADIKTRLAAAAAKRREGRVKS